MHTVLCTLVLSVYCDDQELPELTHPYPTRLSSAFCLCRSAFADLEPSPAAGEPASNPDAHRRHHRAGHAQRRDPVAGRWLAARAEDLRTFVSPYPILESGDGDIRRRGTDLRHDRHIIDRHVDRLSDQQDRKSTRLNSSH